MTPQAVRERANTREKEKTDPPSTRTSPDTKVVSPLFVQPVYKKKKKLRVADTPKPIAPLPAPKPQQEPRIKTEVRTKPKIREQQENQKVQRELKKIQKTHDLRKVDDSVEYLSTLYEWRAQEHNHQPKEPVWFAALAVAVTTISFGFAFFGNIMAAITIGLAGALVYHSAQKEPATLRYRIMTQGIAFNDRLYHFRDLESFNIVYEPGETKTVLIRSHRHFAPLLHMEIGDANPLAIRDILVEFLPEDQDLQEPIVDVWARALGF